MTTSGSTLPLFLLNAILILSASCGPPNQVADEVDDGWQGTVEEEGEVRTVRTTGGSVWPGEGKLVEEAAIGTETRGENDILGRVMAMDVADRRIFILDRHDATVRVYDWDGAHLQNIGRQGQGPGEMRTPTDMGIDFGRSQLIVRESTAGVIHRFSLRGEHIRTQPPSMRGGIGGEDLLLRVTSDGRTIVPNFAHRPAPDTDLGYVSTLILYAVDSTGTRVDSLGLPEYEHTHFRLTASARPGAYRPQPVPFGPQEVWSLGWDGALITGYAAEYRFEIHYPDGHRMIMERETDPVRVKSGEKDWATRKTLGIMRDFQPGWVWNGPEIPGTKAWFSHIVPDRSGRLWVLREGEGRETDDDSEPEDWRGWERHQGWVSDYFFDVFEESTGRYMGRVEAPGGFLPVPEPVIEGDTFICLTEDALGRPIVRRYRLEFPSADSQAEYG